MTNNQIIENAAISAGIFTREQVDEYIQQGRRIPLHTYREWKRMGYRVKPGEHASVVVSLWKFSSKKVELDDGEEVDDSNYYRSSAYLFTQNQVEAFISRKPRSFEEIREYNRMLAEQRKARKSA